MEKLLNELVEIKEQELALINKRRELEKNIAILKKVDLGKTETIRHGDYKFSIQNKTNINYDQKILEDCYLSLTHKQRHKIFGVKYSIKTAELKRLKEASSELYRRIKTAETVSQGAITVRYAKQI